MYTYLMLPAAVRAEVPAVTIERRDRRGRRSLRSPRATAARTRPGAVNR